MPAAKVERRLQTRNLGKEDRLLADLDAILAGQHCFLEELAVLAVDGGEQGGADEAVGGAPLRFYVPNELEAVKRFKVSLLVLVGKGTTADLAHNFVRSLRRIEAFLEGRSPPFIGKVYLATPSELAKSDTASGRVEPWYPQSKPLLDP